VVAAGPAGPRRRLGAELRRLRNNVGMHLDEVADVLGCSTSKVSRLETGKGVPKASDVRQLIRLYGAPAEDERDTLLQLVRDSRAEGWWTIAFAIALHYPPQGIFRFFPDAETASRSQRKHSIRAR